MREYEIILEVRPAEGGTIPKDARKKIVEAVNPLTDGGITRKDFRHGRLEYQYPRQLSSGQDEEDYAAELAAAVRAVPGCDKASGIVVRLGYCLPVYEYDWIEDL